MSDEQGGQPFIWNPRPGNSAEQLAANMIDEASLIWNECRTPGQPRPERLALQTRATMLFLGDAFREMRGQLVRAWEQDYPDPGRWERARQRRVDTAFRKIEKGLAEAKLGMDQLATELMTQDCEPPTKKQIRRRAR